MKMINFLSLLLSLLVPALANALSSDLVKESRSLLKSNSALGGTNSFGPEKIGTGPIKNGYNAMDRPYKGQDKPVVVDVGIKLINLQEISDVDQKLGLNILFNIQWKDPRLVGVVSKNDSPQRIDIMQIWTPGIALANPATPPELLSEGVKLYSDGTVELLRRGLYSASVGVDVSWFPFDSQHMEMMFECPDYDESQVMFKINEKASTTDADGEEIWVLDKWSVTEDTRPSVVSGEPDSYLVGTAVVRRLYAMAVVNLVAPLYIIANFSFIAFFVYQGDFGTRVGIVSTGFLTLIAFLYVITESLPKIAYWTWLHLYCFMTIVMVLYVQIEVVFVHFLDPHDDAASEEVLDSVDKLVRDARFQVAVEKAIDGYKTLNNLEIALLDTDFENKKVLLRCKNAFEDLDIDKNGSVDATELKIALKMIGAPDTSRKKCVEIISKYSFAEDSGPNHLSFPEFIVYAVEQSKQTPIAEDSKESNRKNLLDTVGKDTSVICSLGPKQAITIDYWSKRICVIGYTIITLAMLISAKIYRDGYNRRFASLNSGSVLPSTNTTTSTFFR